MAAASDTYHVSMERGLLDLDFVFKALSGSYWAASRPRPVVEASIRNSLCFGIYRNSDGRQVAFARVVTDGVTFSWLCDVIVDGGERGKGLGKMLMEAVSAHPVVKATQCILGTRDAHGLYEKYGFARAEMMRRSASPAP